MATWKLLLNQKLLVPTQRPPLYSYLDHSATSLRQTRFHELDYLEVFYKHYADFYQSFLSYLQNLFKTRLLPVWRKPSDGLRTLFSSKFSQQRMVVQAIFFLAFLVWAYQTRYIMYNPAQFVFISFCYRLIFYAQNSSPRQHYKLFMLRTSLLLSCHYLQIWSVRRYLVITDWKMFVCMVANADTLNIFWKRTPTIVLVLCSQELYRIRFYQVRTLFFRSSNCQCRTVSYGFYFL